MEGLPNVDEDDGGRKLSHLSPGTEKAARHDGKFGTSAPELPSATCQLTRGAKAPRLHAARWRTSFLDLVLLGGRHIAFHNIGAPSFNTLAHKTPSARRYPSVGPKKHDRTWAWKEREERPPIRAPCNAHVSVGDLVKRTRAACLSACTLTRCSASLNSAQFYKLSLMLIGLRLKRRERLTVVTKQWHRRRKERFLRPTSSRTADHVAAQSPVSCRRATESA